MQRGHGRARGHRATVCLGPSRICISAHGLQIRRNLRARRGPVIQRELHCIQDCMVVLTHIRHIEDNGRNERVVHLETCIGIRVELNHLNCTTHPALNNVRVHGDTVHKGRIINVLILEAQIKLTIGIASDRAHLIIVGGRSLGADKTEGNRRH